MAEEQTKSNLVLIKQFFLSDMTAREALAEIKQLTDEDKEQLGMGISTGTLSY